jgi:hypothetical protein
MDVIFETWEDIGRSGLKFFKGNMIRDIETSFTYQTLEEIVTRLERNFVEEGIDEEEIKRKRLETLYDYYCWNLKLINTEKFYANIKKFEKIIYETGLIDDEKRITQMIKISLGVEKHQQFFNDLSPKFNIFKEKRKRHIYNCEEILDANDDIKGNPINGSDESKRARLRRRRIKKRVKYREKLKKKKKALREELRMKEDGCTMSIVLEEIVKGDTPKDEVLKRSIKEAASTLHGLTAASKEFQKTSNWKRLEKDLKNSDRSGSERKLESNMIEEIYSFKTMLRMLYQAGVVILR